MNKELYPTWLDWYVKKMVERMPKTDKDDLEEFHIASIRTLQYVIRNQLSSTHKENSEEHYTFQAQEYIQIALIAYSARYTAQERADMEPNKKDLFTTFKILSPIKGIKLSPALMPAFVRAKAPDIKHIQKQLTEQYHYIDIPHNTLLVGKDCQIRAIFGIPSSPLSDLPVLVAIITKQGMNELVGGLLWVLGEHATEQERLLINTPIEEKIQSSLNQYQLNTEIIKKNAESIITLGLLCDQSAEKSHRTLLPMLDTTSVSKQSRKKQQRKHKTHSLFAIHELHLPGDSFGRDLSHIARTDGTREGWQLDHCVDVEGHYRWQPHGKESKQRKLIWINAYVRGKNLPVKPSLDVIHA